MNNWASLHIFYHDIVYKELLLCDIIAPYLRRLMEKGKIEKWFFINYWDGGPHIRVRIKGIDKNDYDALKDSIKKYIKINKSRINITREQYYEKNKLDGEKVDKDNLPWYEDGTIKEIEYKPEYERYGGEKEIELAEDIFCYSSDISATIIKNTIEKFNSRFGVAVNIFIKVLYDIGCLNITFLKMYSSWWGEYLGEGKSVIKKQIYNIIARKVDEIVNDDYENGLVNYYSNLVKEYFVNLRDMGIKENIACSIIASQMHMTNNRLAITPEYEYIIAESVLEKLKENSDGEVI